MKRIITLVLAATLLVAASPSTGPVHDNKPHLGHIIADPKHHGHPAPTGEIGEPSTDYPSAPPTDIE